jgi:hypothetical protein
MQNLFATTLANRLRPSPTWRTWPSSERWSASDSTAKAFMRGLDGGRWHDGVLSTPAFSTTRLTTLGPPLAGAADSRENDDRLTSTGS